MVWPSFSQGILPFGLAGAGGEIGVGAMKLDGREGGGVDTFAANRACCGDVCECRFDYTKLERM